MDPISILHIPHSSIEVPSKERAGIYLSDDELQSELIKMTDWFTDDLFSLKSPLASSVKYPVSRLIVDPERFEDDAQEVMAAKGMGVIYSRTSGGKKLRDVPNPQERKRLLKTYYHPHHAKLNSLVADSLSKHRKALIVDCHSFPSKPHPHEGDQRADRPDICIGTDSYHTPSWISEYIVNAFKAEGFLCAINTPYSGSMVPVEYYQTNRSVSAVMVEINRKLYLDEESGRKGTQFTMMKSVIHHVLSRFINVFRIHPS